VGLGENRHKEIPGAAGHQASDHLSFDADSGQQLAPDAAKVSIGDRSIATQFRPERIAAEAPPDLAERLGRLGSGRAIALITPPIGDLEAAQTGKRMSMRDIDDDRTFTTGS
jgi:hypothetical protein